MMCPKILVYYWRLTRKPEFFYFVVLFLICINPFWVNKYYQEAPVKGWPQNRSRNARDYICSNATPRILPTEFCAYTTKYLILVHSSCNDSVLRNVIRNTWGSKTFGNASEKKVYFLLGETSDSAIQAVINAENYSHDDIIQEHFVDTYENLTLKSIAMLKIASMCSGRYKYLVKVDSDVFLNVRILNRFLYVIGNDMPRFMAGFEHPHDKRIMEYNSKWYSPRYMYRNQFYGPFLSGTCYLISEDLVQELYETTLTTPIFHLEDVYITGICAEKMKVKIISSSVFSECGIPFSELCTFPNLISVHGFTTQTFFDSLLALPHLVKACKLLLGR